MEEEQEDGKKGFMIDCTQCNGRFQIKRDESDVRNYEKFLIENH